MIDAPVFSNLVSRTDVKLCSVIGEMLAHLRPVAAIELYELGPDDSHRFKAWKLLAETFVNRYRPEQFNALLHSSGNHRDESFLKGLRSA